MTDSGVFLQALLLHIPTYQRVESDTEISSKSL